MGVESPVVVADYIFQNEVVSLFAKKKTKVFIFCDLKEEETYHPSVSFYSNNFQEIVNEILILKSYKLPPLPTTKVFLCSRNKDFFSYGETLEDFNLKVRCF